MPGVKTKIASVDPHFCETCHRTFKTAAALGSHNKSTHNIAGTSHKHKSAKPDQKKKNSSLSKEDLIAILEVKIAAMQDVLKILRDL